MLRSTDPHFDLDDQDYCLKSLTATADPDTNAPTTDDQTITYDVTQKATSTGGPIFWGNVQPASSDQEAAAPYLPACARRVGWVRGFFLTQSVSVWGPGIPRACLESRRRTRQ